MGYALKFAIAACFAGVRILVCDHDFFFAGYATTTFFFERAHLQVCHKLSFTGSSEADFSPTSRREAKSHLPQKCHAEQRPKQHRLAEFAESELVYIQRLAPA